MIVARRQRLGVPFVIHSADVGDRGSPDRRRLRFVVQHGELDIVVVVDEIVVPVLVGITDVRFTRLRPNVHRSGEPEQEQGGDDAEQREERGQQQRL